MLWRGLTKPPLLLALLALASACCALLLAWTSFGLQFDKYAFDFLFRLEQPRPWTPQSIILAIDEQTLTKYGYPLGLRAALASGLEAIAPVRPAAVAVDLILAEPSDPAVDARLERAFAQTPNLVLSADLLLNGSGWEKPVERFRRHAVSIGQVHAALDTYDAVSRQLPLEKIAGRERLWALSLEAFATGDTVAETTDEVIARDVHIPARARDERLMRIRYIPPSMGGIPRVSVAELDRDPGLAARFAGKVVFAGVTAQTAVQDRWMTPFSSSVFMPGVEIHANAFETIARQAFLTDASPVPVVLACFFFAAAAALIYGCTVGWISNLLAALLIVVSQILPAIAFAWLVVWPWTPTTLAAIFGIASAAAWRHVLVRGQLLRTEREKKRYQSAMQFVTHEMRTPLTAIQGSSELISRYSAMPEAKRLQIAELINTESRRLARMIETFLNVERLSAGEMELKQDRFPLVELVNSCTKRAMPVAERKRIAIEVKPLPAHELTGDRELIEYAVYNLLTNAVKYSPPDTRVTVFGENGRGELRLSVQDEGIGMDKKEVNRIFEKFYRTRRAEQSGEAGTGIGLSIVEQIVAQHGGTIQVESEPGKGSRFTLILK